MKALVSIGHGGAALGELVFYNPQIALPLITGIAALSHSYLRHRRINRYQDSAELRGRLTQLDGKIRRQAWDSIQSEELKGVATLEELQASEEARTRALKSLEPQIQVVDLAKEDASAQWEMLTGLFLIVVSLVLWDREANLTA